MIRYINFGDDVRLRYRKSFQGIYKELAGDRDAGKEGLLFQDNGELFLFCANLGLKEGKMSEASKLSESSEFRFSSIKGNYLRTLYFLVAVMGGHGLKNESFEDAKTLKTIVEAYADAGMEILLVQLLKDYFEFRKDHYTFIGDRESMDFHKSWLYYLLEIKQV